MMVCHIMKNYYMYWKPLYDLKFSKLDMTHFGFNKTMELVFHDYWWPQL
jgi:hypothetical protein